MHCPAILSQAQLGSCPHLTALPTQISMAHAARCSIYHSVLNRTTLSHSNCAQRSGRVRVRCHSVDLEKKNIGKQSLSVHSNIPGVNLPSELNPDRMPKHLALICDGNNRYGKENGLPGIGGLDAGLHNLKDVLKTCISWGIKIVTIYQFSFDNWRRSEKEVEQSFEVFEKHLTQNRGSIKSHQIQFSVIGEVHLFPERFLKLVKDVEDESRGNNGLMLVVAGGYSGRMDILRACKGIAQQVHDGKIKVEDIDESALESQLYTHYLPYPDPDVMIRTSGEQRISNFTLWQLAYSELVFVPEKWPDFKPDGLKAALVQFQSRKRRFGGRPSKV